MAKILLVEDDNNLREIYEARLQAEGYTIVSANDGEAALVVAKNEKPDLIISDVMMPKISGFEMLDILRNTDGLKDAKVIMLTALGQADDQARANKLGADKYLVKSQVTLEDIVRVSHELLEDSSEAATPAPEASDSTAIPVATDDSAATDAPATPATTSIPVSTPPDDAAESAADQPAEPATDEAEAAKPSDPPAAAATAPIPSMAAPAVAPDVSSAQTSADEEATVEKQIETFVESQPGTPPAAVDQAAANDANDQAVLNDAVNTLVTDTEGPAAAPDTKASVAPANEPDAPTSIAGDKVEVAHKKVIQPLDSPPKKSLDQLLAEEQAKEAGSSPAAQPVVGDANTPSVDPNSIAL